MWMKVFSFPLPSPSLDHWTLWAHCLQYIRHQQDWLEMSEPAQLSSCMLWPPEWSCCFEQQEQSYFLSVTALFSASGLWTETWICAGAQVEGAACQQTAFWRFQRQALQFSSLASARRITSKHPDIYQADYNPKVLQSFDYFLWISMTFQKFDRSSYD